MRRRPVLILAALGSAAVLVMASVEMSRDGVDVPEQGPWLIFVDGRSGLPAECTSDSAVTASYQPAVMPPAGVTLELRADAARSDVDRVTECLSADIPASAIRVETDPRH